ncbi:type II toxin-antitoxin system RelE/ParE family toxin [Achromobacter marplatensis]|uniref:type II toxin-antitoxin system RelE/ParE family toxin n=1 Tax=Achromobacter marplatensis TaxID=470868 RepID=UPI003C728E08
MKGKPVIPRLQANEDIDTAIAYYSDQASEQVALGFIDALERAYSHLSRHAATGSSKYAHELDLPGLQSWPLTRYPYLIFYVDCPSHIDVWRVLHQQRNIPAWMHGPAGL